MPGKKGGGKTRVLIAAASSSRVTELERLVQENSSLELAGSVSTLSTLAQTATGLYSDVILVDLADPDAHFSSLVPQGTGAAVMVLVDDPDRNWTRQMLRGGVLGILPRNSSSA